RCLGRLDEVLAREAARIRPAPHRIADLRRDHQLVAIAMLGDECADDLLADAVGIVVAGVDEVDARLDRTTEYRAALFEVEHPRAPRAVAEPHRAKPEPRDL